MRDHQTFPHIARLTSQMVHNNGGTAARNFAGVTDPEANVMRLLDECLSTEGIDPDDLQSLDCWLGTLSAADFDTVADGEETDVLAITATAPDLGDVPGSAVAFINNIFEACI